MPTKKNPQWVLASQGSELSGCIYQSSVLGTSSIFRIKVSQSIDGDANQKKSPVGVSQPGELVIRVHLPIICSRDK
ncbi:hypothetical protein GS682_05920 [Nostoc sp. B(2019)]|nr:hypothetical protein [Nostoc sp. B(2019)]